MMRNTNQSRDEKSPRATARRSAFTLIELLVIVAIIVVLLSIILPAMGGAVGKAQDVQCRSQLRQIAMGFATFSADHYMTLPGVTNTEGAEDWQKSWMGSEAVFTLLEGTLIPYLGGLSTALPIYRCPTLMDGWSGTGKGSNGKFDYSSIRTFSGAQRSSIPATSMVRNITTNVWTRVPTPMIVEEDPAASLNMSGYGPDHDNTDRLTTTHDLAGNYATIDGSTLQIKSLLNKGPTTATDWIATSPSNIEVNLKATNLGFGQWQKR